MPAQSPPAPRSSSKYYAASALVASRAASRVLAVRRRGLSAMVRELVSNLILQARLAETATSAMLQEQGVDVAPEARLRPESFAPDLSEFQRIMEGIEADFEARLARLVESTAQDVARAAQQVSVTVRPNVAHVRHLNLPSCSRCAILAGRVYRYSEGFLRHPGCDCVMVPVTVGTTAPYDIDELVRNGQVTGLSKADRLALQEGADFGQIVNVRARAAGLTESGRVLRRGSRMTPEAIFRATGDDRDAALRLLAAHGYIR